jgi:hypothetical protein
MAACPSCKRPVAVARPTCLYCGKALPRDLVVAAAARHAIAPAPSLPGLPGPLAPSPNEPAALARTLLVIEVGATSATTLAQALELPAFEGQLRHRLGGLQLHRTGEDAAVREEAARLAAAGLQVHLVPEAEARIPPLRTTGGRLHSSSLQLYIERGVVHLAAEDLLLVVRGPIQREYQSRAVERKKPRTAALEPGYLFHLHRQDGLPPLELDPAAFVFGAEAPVTGSTLLELTAWVREFAAGVPEDDGFRRLPPALGPAAPEQGAGASLRQSRGGWGSRGTDAAPVLDNTAQFRLYSGWRGAVERRRTSTGETAPPR